MGNLFAQEKNLTTSAIARMYLFLTALPISGGSGRKIAVAEFEPLVSGDIYALTTKGHHLLSELLLTSGRK